MSFTTDTFARAAFKRLAYLAHTGNHQDPANESTLSAPLVEWDRAIGEVIANNPATAVTAGVVELVTFDLAVILGSHDLAYEATFPASYSGAFGAGAQSQPLRNYTFGIPKAWSTDITYYTNVDANGWIPILKAGATVIAESNAADWSFDPVSGIVTAETAFGSTPTTIKTYVFIGDTIKDAIDAKLTTATLTTKGDLLTRSASAVDRLGVGTDGHVLTADAAQTLGVKWAAAAGGGASALDDLTDVTITAAAANDFLAYNGSAWVDLPLFATGNTWTAAQSFSLQITSTLATGTSPFSIASTTVCTNLNADLLDGSHASAFATSGHTHALDDLSDVTITAPATGSMLQYNGLAWIDFDLLAAANTWALLQTFTSGGTFNSTLTVADTISARFANANMSITGTNATTLLEIRANNSVSAGQITLDPRVTLDCQINSASHLTLNSTALLLLTAIPMYFGSSTQFVKGTSASALLEISSTNTAGIIRYNAKATHDFHIDSSATAEMALAADSLMFNAGATYDVGFGWPTEGQLDTIIAATVGGSVANFVAIETTVAASGSWASGVKQVFRGIGLDGNTEADVGSFHAYYDDLASANHFDWTIENAGATNQYHFQIGSSSILRMDPSQVEFYNRYQINSSFTSGVVFNADDVATQFKISAKSASEVQLTTAGTSNPSIIIRPRGNAECIFNSASTAAFDIRFTTTVTTLNLGPNTTSAVTWNLNNQTSGVLTLNLATSGSTYSKVNIGKSHASSTLSFFGATAVVQQVQTTDLKDQLVNYGLTATGAGATPLDLDGGTLTAVKLVATELEFAGSITIDPTSASATTVTVDNSGAAKTTLRLVPDTCSPSDDTHYAKVGGTLNPGDNLASSTATTSEETVASYTIKANTFLTSGSELWYRFDVAFDSSARSKAIRIKIGSGSSSADVLGVATLGGGGFVQGRIVRQSAGTLMSGRAWSVPNATGYATSGIAVATQSTDDGTSDVVLAIRSIVGAGAAAGDVVITNLVVEWKPGGTA